MEHYDIFICNKWKILQTTNRRIRPKVLLFEDSFGVLFLLLWLYCGTLSGRTFAESKNLLFMHSISNYK